MSNTWVNHVKNFALQNNITYKEALLLAKPSYKKELKGTGSGNVAGRNAPPITVAYVMPTFRNDGNVLVITNPREFINSIVDDGLMFYQNFINSNNIQDLSKRIIDNIMADRPITLPEYKKFIENYDSVVWLTQEYQYRVQFPSVKELLESIPNVNIVSSNLNDVNAEVIGSDDNATEIRAERLTGSGQNQGRSRIHPSNQFDPLIQRHLTDEIDYISYGHSPISRLGNLRFLNRRVILGRASAHDLEVYRQLYQTYLRNDTVDDISDD
jgi:hypothetical protein